MLPITKSTTKECQVEDSQTIGKSTLKQYFDGQRWMESCTVYDCNRLHRVKGLCVQHLKERGESQHSYTHSILGDLLMGEHGKTKSEKRKLLEEKDDSIHNAEENIKPSSFDDIPSITDQIRVSTSSITIIPADTSSKTLTSTSINENDTTQGHICRYQISSTGVLNCRNQGTYQCPHCGIFYCLQHGVKHQEDLKTEIRHLLTKSQEFFDNIQKLNIIDVKTSCAKQLDQWATTMHSKIEQIHHDLQMTLKHCEKQIHDNSDQLKKYLSSNLEQHVGSVLTEQLQKFEIDKSQIEKANLEYNRLENLFNLFNNQQLITLVVNTGNEVNLNPPVIIGSDIMMDGLNLPVNSPEKMDQSSQQTNELSKNSKCETEVSSLTANEIKDDTTEIITSTMDNRNTTIDNKRDDTDIQVIQHFSADGEELFPDLFNEHIFNASVDDFLREEVVLRTNDSQRKSSLKKSKPTTLKISLHNTKFSLENISAHKRDGSELDLSGQELGDQDMQVVIQYALTNSKLTQPFKILNLSSNQIGSRGMHFLCNALERNTTLTKLSLDTNHILDRGAQYLGNLLRKNSTLTELDISRNQIGFQGIIGLSNALKENTTLTLLNLEHNLIGPKGAERLCAALQHNNTLRILNLNWCVIDEIGTQYLSKTLKYNTSIDTLELAGNRFGEVGALCFIHVLRQNSSLIKLNLQTNQLGETGAFYLSDGLRNNKTLRELNLEQNQLRDTGIKHICDALRHNTTLTTLNLSNNSVGKMGAQYIGDLLSTNKTLTTLDLSSNEVQSAGSMYISDAICKNKTLTVLNLQQNRIGQRGIRFLVDATKENDTLITFNLKGNSVTAIDETIISEQLMQNKMNKAGENK